MFICLLSQSQLQGLEGIMYLGIEMSDGLWVFFNLNFLYFFFVQFFCHYFLILINEFHNHPDKDCGSLQLCIIFHLLIIKYLKIIYDNVLISFRVTESNECHILHVRCRVIIIFYNRINIWSLSPS